MPNLQFSLDAILLLNFPACNLVTPCLASRKRRINTQRKAIAFSNSLIDSPDTAGSQKATNRPYKTTETIDCHFLSTGQQKPTTVLQPLPGVAPPTIAPAWPTAAVWTQPRNIPRPPPFRATNPAGWVRQNVVPGASMGVDGEAMTPTVARGALAVSGTVARGGRFINNRQRSVGRRGRRGRVQQSRANAQLRQLLETWFQARQ